jgi:hypothetical protein
MNYLEFIERKELKLRDCGLPEVPELNPLLFDFQSAIVGQSLRKGRYALFCDCGLGKTPMQLEWASQVPGRVLILAPLAVAQQTVREGKKFGHDVRYIRSQTSDSAKIHITNYEMLEHFYSVDQDYSAVVLDESSILKSYSGSMRNQIVSTFERTPYRLACTATPAPNDYMELGNHSEFLGALTRTEMLSTFFVHDGGDTAKWRLKRHAERDFWRWVCSWAVMARKPSDLGFDDGKFIIPELRIHDVNVQVNKPTDGRLFSLPAITLEERRHARQDSVIERGEMVAEIASRKPNEPWIVWCNLNTESEVAAELIPDAVELRGSDDREDKAAKMLDFAAGNIRVLVTKPSIAGFGMNWQHCANVQFLGLSDSYEQFYQAVRRCWRFGQTRPVDCYIVTSSNEGAVTENIKRKERDAAKLAEEMIRSCQLVA